MLEKISIFRRPQHIDYMGIVLWLIRASIIILVVWGTVATVLDNPYTPRAWLDFVIFGIAQGSMYALIAIGYTLVYGVLFMINFAHGRVLHVRDHDLDGFISRTVRLRVDSWTANPSWHC